MPEHYYFKSNMSRFSFTEPQLIEHLLSESKIDENLMASPVINCDETSVRINGKTRWCHVASNHTNTAYFCHNKRGTDAMNEMGILPKYKGVAVHDNWKPYFTYKDMSHSLCNAHHIRELRGINENYDQSWAKEMRKHLLDINSVVNAHKQEGKDCLPEEKIKRHSERYDAILNSATTQIPALKPAEIIPKKRGRSKQHPAKNLHDRLTNQKNETLRFMYNFRVPFTNNQAEQDVRMTKVKLKVSGCFRSQEGADRFCRIRGYISTSRKRGLNILQSIENRTYAYVC
jgi:transposase